MYKPLNTFIALIGLEIWTDSDKIVVSTPAAETLSAFTKWRNNDLMQRKKHDNAHLITLVQERLITVMTDLFSFFTELNYAYHVVSVNISVKLTLTGQRWAWLTSAPCAQTPPPVSSRYQKEELYFIKIDF